MMPVIRLSDATFSYLQEISIWMATETPPAAIDKLVQEKMEELSLMCEAPEADPTQPLPNPMEVEKNACLTFTRVLSASINSELIAQPKWGKLLETMFTILKEKGLSEQQLVREIQIPTEVSVCSERGYVYKPELGISYQRQSAICAWNEVDRIAEKWGVPVVVTFQWRENKKALHPGRSGIIRAGMNNKKEIDNG